MSREIRTMGDFWRVMSPWLIMAVFLPLAIVLSLKLMPSTEWAEGLIREWADIEGFQVVAIDDAPGFKRLFTSTHKVYLVRVLDETGRERSCKAKVGRFLLGSTYQNIAITWTNDR